MMKGQKERKREWERTFDKPILISRGKICRQSMAEAGWMRPLWEQGSGGNREEGRLGWPVYWLDMFSWPACYSALSSLRPLTEELELELLGIMPQSSIHRRWRKPPVLITALFIASFTPSGPVCCLLMVWTLSGLSALWNMLGLLFFRATPPFYVSDRLQCRGCTPEVNIVQWTPAQSCCCEWVITMWRGLSPETGLVFLLLV